MIKLLSLLLAVLSCLKFASAAPPVDIWSLTLLANDDVDGQCQAEADALGQEVQDTFNAAVPGFTTYFPDTSTGRFLRSVQRDLGSVNLCSRTYCSKPANYQACIWSGCSCSCGRGRELAAASSSDTSKVLAAKRKLDEMLRLKSIELGCDLGLVMVKARG